MSELTTTSGWLPMRRIIVIVFVLAALATGASRYSVTQATPTAAIDTNVLPTRIAATGEPVCDGSVINTDCASVEGLNPGPVVPLGYGSAAQAKFHCAGGEIITLYRQHQIVGYGCLGGGSR